MKKVLIVLLAVLYMAPTQKVQAQGNGGAAVAAGVAGLLAIGGAIAAIEELKESFELRATQEILSTTDMANFKLQIFDLKGGVKAKDVGDVSIVAFRVNDWGNSKRYVLLALLSRNWRNANGVDYTKVKWDLIDRDQWLDMASFYVNLASKKDATTPESVAGMKIVNRGVKEGKKITIPFSGISGDTYLVGNYSNEYKIVFNEKSFSLFLKETTDLVQLRRGTIIDIHDFLRQP